MMFEAGKEYRTEDKRRALIYEVYDYEIHGVVFYLGGEMLLTKWGPDGISREGFGRNLMPPKRECWVLFNDKGKPVDEAPRDWHESVLPMVKEERDAGYRWVRMIEADD